MKHFKGGGSYKSLGSSGTNIKARKKERKERKIKK
jgi:hypothetical protein